MKNLSKAIRMLRIFSAYRMRRESLPYMPLRLWIESASCCNLRCIMCPNKDVAASQKGVMRLELFRKIIDEIRASAHDIYLHHRGEPLLNPALFDMIQYAKNAGLKTRFHTNGALLDAARAQRLLAAAPDLVSFSFDGFTKETYERVRVGAKFEQTLENIIRLAELRRAQNLKKPYLVIEKIRFKDKITEGDQGLVAQTRQRLLASGVDEIIEKEEYVWAEPNAPDASSAERTYSACTFPWYAMVICADGTVTPCPQDFHAVMKLGNAQTESLREIWNGRPYRDLRRQMAADVTKLELCHKCDRLCRKTLGGVPLQYMATFLTDQLLGYGRIRKWLGTHERNK